MAWEITIAILWLQVVLAAKIAYDLRLWYRREKKGTGTKTVVHWKEWILMAAGSTPSIYLFQSHLSLHWALSWALSGLMCAFYLWVMFDGLYNVFRGFRWFFTGSVDADDAKADKLLRRIGLAGQIILKFGGLAVTVFLYLKYFS